VRIDIWSDVVCPWCYLGHRRFATALGQLPDVEVDVHWRAFELDPHAPSEPQDLVAVLERKYGPGAYESMTARLTALGEAEAIEYRFDRTLRVNTFDAHRLVAWSATQPHGQDPVVERLFRAYFTEGANVGDADTLLGIVEALGGDRAGAAAVLGSDAFADTVRADEALARENEVTGVPAFVLGERLMIPGAQEVDTFVRVIERAVERFTPQG
jgi:predicted DsbA family dithiol-disulfide isomerase